MGTGTGYLVRGPWAGISNARGVRGTPYLGVPGRSSVCRSISIDVPLQVREVERLLEDRPAERAPDTVGARGVGQLARHEGDALRELGMHVLDPAHQLEAALVA